MTGRPPPPMMSSMSYFITGATGFIGKRLLERLLTRDGTIYALVREQSSGRLARIADSLGAGDRVRPVVGDLTAPRLGVSDAQLAELTGNVEHFFHLAAIYDLTADASTNVRVNEGGTRRAVALANAISARCVHHVSSVAVAGDHVGTFTEEMFDAGQPLRHPYHRTKFDSEQIVRSQTSGAWRVYRPAVVIGDSRTGEIDKVDGPYYFLPVIKRLRALPAHWRVPWPRMGHTNVVPVDFVAGAIDHIAHSPGLDRRAFHLVDPFPQRSLDVFNAFAAAAGAPLFAPVLPAWTFDAGLAAPGIRSRLLPRLGIPPAALDHREFTARFDAAAATAALAGSGLTPPPLSTYAPDLWRYWAEHLDPERGDRESRHTRPDRRTIPVYGNR
jgi:thioester reductase-like protein